VAGFTAEQLPPEWAAVCPEGFTLIQRAADQVWVFHLDNLGRDLVGELVTVREVMPPDPVDTGTSSQLGARIPSYQDLLRSGWDTRAGESSGGSALREVSAPELPSSSPPPVPPRQRHIHRSRR